MTSLAVGMTNEQWQHQIMQQVMILRGILELEDSEAMRHKLNTYVERLEDTLKKP